MRSLQAKLTLSLLLTSLVSVALVGLIARGMLLHKFDEIAMQQSLQDFRSNMQAYIATYGTWKTANQKQPFRQFIEGRQTAAMPRNEMEPRDADGGPMASAATPGNQPPAPPEMGEPGRAEPGQEGQGQAGQGPGEPSQAPGSGPDMGQGAPGAPPRSGDDSVFRFIVLDPNGIVLMGPPELKDRPAPPDWRADAEPVMVNGQTAVLVVPYGEANYSAQDLQYLRAMGQALVRGVLGATVLALALGLFFGNRLSRTLRGLTGAIEAMGEGELRQQVKVTSGDEVGVLAAAFNRMSGELARTHEELKESHSQISRQAALLKELSTRDGLTKLHNRRFFDERGAYVFAQSKRYNRPLTVMIGDIDFFKRINDTFSHAVGDEVLRHVAAILQKNTRDIDIVARYGGEEFVIAFPETHLLAALALCERLRVQIEAHDWHAIHPDLRVTMSMGLNQDMTLGSFEKMVAAADTRLYSAKEGGRNRVCAPIAA